MQREARQLRRHPLASDPNFSVAGRAANRTRATRAMAALPEGARGAAPGIAAHVAGFLNAPARDPPMSLAEQRRAAAVGRVGTRRSGGGRVGGGRHIRRRRRTRRRRHRRRRTRRRR